MGKLLPHTIPKVLELGKQCHAFHHPVELLNTLLPSGLPPHKLVLKVGAPVVFIRNLNREQGIMNGTRGVIQSCPSDIAFTTTHSVCLCTMPWGRLKYRLQVLLTTGPKAGTSVAVPRINLSVSDASDEVALHGRGNFFFSFFNRIRKDYMP